ncbi:porin [Pseudoduganella namucuonensis]|uniref:Outer membrane protein (Porin) n=1 Tax=Pseudoduganella namucuonensis TaxID=1035707 RepID=A0A1I7IHH5_9BURK|nr:porin [Pseudoduganella namucuonensis]SFU72383.1 Outer membrane protein (porin) [Pseudoduganella namucuonensis]
MKSTIFFGCLALACGAAAAQGNVTIYGRLNVALERAETSANAAGRPLGLTRMVNNRSVFGFRGVEDLGGGMRAVFQIEGTLSPDTGEGSPAQRDTRVGLEGGFGALFLGHWTTPYNNATSGLDPFYPTTAGYMSIMGNGSGSTVDNVGNLSSFDRRQQNSVSWYSPAWRGLSLRAAHGVGEERPANGAKPSLTSLAAVYEQGPWYATLAHELHRDYQGAGRDDTGTKLAAAYRFGDTRVAAIVEKLAYETATGKLDSRQAHLSVTHQIGPHGLRFGVARAGDGKGASTQKIGYLKKGADTGATHYTLGYDYAFSKRTSAFVYHTRLDNEANAAHDFAINGLTVSPGATLKGTAAGLRHSF